MEKLIYPILRNEDLRRSEFTTIAGVTYACYFVSAENVFKRYPDVANIVYIFNLYVEAGNNREQTIDERIGLTVTTIIKEFLLKNQTAVIYLCDMSDGREALRRRKFNSWFRRFETGDIVKLDKEIKVRGAVIFNSLIIADSNPLFDKIVAAFEDFNERANNK